METLAIVWAAKLFRPYLLGNPCEVITDHAAHTSLLSNRNPSSKLARMAMCVQELNLKINYRPGKNLVADVLLRNPLPVADVLQVGTDNSTKTAPESDIAKLQLWLEKGQLPADCKLAEYLKVEQSNFEIIDGVLCYCHPMAPNLVRIAVPSCTQSTLLKESHSGKFAGHFDGQKVYSTLREQYWWRGMRNDVRRNCRSCLVCASRKEPGRRQRPKLQPIPFHTVGVYVLPLPRTLEGNQYTIVLLII